MEKLGLGRRINVVVGEEVTFMTRGLGRIKSRVVKHSLTFTSLHSQPPKRSSILIFYAISFKQLRIITTIKYEFTPEIFW